MNAKFERTKLLPSEGVVDVESIIFAALPTGFSFIEESIALNDSAATLSALEAETCAFSAEFRRLMRG